MKSLTQNGSKSKLQGIVIALCCHHRCNLKAVADDVEYLKYLGISPTEYSLILSASAWFTCNFPASVGAEVQARKRDCGWKCKRILDIGRLRYLESFGMSAFLQHYVESKYSLENVALVALNHAINLEA
jgi:tRNA:m4X modification enzyme